MKVSRLAVSPSSSGKLRQNETCGHWGRTSRGGFDGFESRGRLDRRDNQGERRRVCYKGTTVGLPASAATAVAAIATTSTATALARFGLVHFQATTLHLVVIELRYG